MANILLFQHSIVFLILSFFITKGGFFAQFKTLCRQAPEFREVVDRGELSSFVCRGDLFYALVESIVSQQLAVRAVDAIFRRLEALLGEVSTELAVEFDALRARAPSWNWKASVRS